LTERGQTVALAESCTGGFIAHRLTNVPGASAVFMGGCVTYSNAAKVSQLGVRAQTLEAHGAVSGEVAHEMAEGARRIFDTTFALAATGVAGPGGGTEEKPAGTVYVALASSGATNARRLFFPFDRETFKFVTAQTALDLLRVAIVGGETS
jgi:nicotinamide-nucleotide amidase